MKRRLLVCDLDNTLYDWVSYFVTAFYAMVDQVVEITGCDRERLLDDFREVHRRYHDSEHPFALLETRTVIEHYPRMTRAEIAGRLDRAFHAFNSMRRRSLLLYPGVREGLDQLRADGVILVAHTESNLYAVVDRLTRLHLSEYFSAVYCRERAAADHPNPNIARDWLREFPVEKVRELSRHQRKPNPDVLLEICNDQRVAPDEAAYVGDSIARDILMARSTGVYAVWAKYGTSHMTDAYSKLVRVTHWTDEDVIRERELSEKARSTKPDFTLERGFFEIVDVFSSSQASRLGRSS